MAIVKDLGVVTAYAYAVAGGYEGTEAEFTEALGRAGIVVEQLENLTAVATTLSEGTEATASYADGVLTFGIPKGDTGATGPQGEQGVKGDTGNGIASIVKTGTSGLVDMYTITFTDGTTTTFEVANGADGDIANVAQVFDATKAYSAGDMVLYQGTLYTFTAAHAAGAWVGSDAQAVILADEVTALKDDLGNFIYSAHPAAGSVYVHIPIADSVPAGVKIFAQALSVDSNVVSANLVGQYSGERTLIDLTDGNAHTYTTALAYTNVEVLYQLTNATDGNTVYNAICVKSDDPVSLSKSLGEFENTAYEVFNTIDSPFDVNVDTFCRGIVAIRLLSVPGDNFQPETIGRVRLNNIYYKMSGFYMHIALQCYRNNAWENYDSFTILTADAPVEQPVMIFNSTYGRVQIAIITSLMSAGSKTNAGYTFKKIAINPFLTDTQKQINNLTTELQYGNYEDQDAIKHVIHVDPNGNGDYTTIAAAYAAITDSSFINQYEIILEPGIYEEYNLICPAYTHTHGYDWKTTIVTSENALGTSTLPVFDQRSYPSKLSNMTIISGTGYCIHNDYAFINTGAVYNENLYCKKVYGEPVQNFAWKSKTNPTIIGAGAQYNGTKIVYNNCTFEDGAVVCHSNSNSVEEGNFHLIFKNCKSVNAYVQLLMAGNSGAATRGLWICEMDGFTVPIGCPALVTKVGARLNDETLFGWQIIGGNNKNFAVTLDNAADTLTTNIPWNNVNTNEKIYCQAVAAVTKGQWVTDALTVAAANENHHNIMGIALTDAAVGDTFPVWAGNAYSMTGANGEYGIGSNGTLSETATEKIGRIRSNIFYRY